MRVQQGEAGVEAGSLLRAVMESLRKYPEQTHEQPACCFIFENYRDLLFLARRISSIAGL